MRTSPINRLTGRAPRVDERLLLGVLRLWRRSPVLAATGFASVAIAAGVLAGLWVDHAETAAPVTRGDSPTQRQVSSVVRPDALPPGVVQAGFDVLAGFPFEAPGYLPDGKTPEMIATANRQIPETVRALDGQRVRVCGFLLSSDFSQGRTREFLVLRDHMLCCFGQRPAGHEWIVVKVPPPGVEITQNVPMYVIGTLHVGAVVQNGFFSQLYTLDGESVQPAPDSAITINPLLNPISKKP